VLVKRKRPRDEVPTLNDLVEEPSPGQGDRTVAEELEHGAAQSGAPPGDQTEHPARTRSAFEVAIEAMVSEILNRHIASAREEITSSVLAEVRTRLAGSSRAQTKKTQTK
jgi:hypothetical protein